MSYERSWLEDNFLLEELKWIKAKKKAEEARE